LRKHAILETIAEFGDPVIAGRYAAAKKSELAMAAEKLCAGSTIVEPAVKARALGWVPSEMRFVSPVQMTQDARDEQAEVEPSEANIDDLSDSGASYEPAEIETALA
jgi:ParB family transcriptional regulator, chromosome partitioning protein